MVSLHDRDARPIAKGRLGKPVEFGYKGQIVDNDDGIVVDHQMHAENPADAPQLAPAIQRIKARTGRAPRTVTAGPWLRRSGHRPGIDRAWCSHRRHSRKGRPGLARQQNAEPSAEPSSGEPDAKAASAPSNTHTAGTAPAWTASRERKPGPGRELHPQPDQDRRIDRLTPSSEKIDDHNDRRSATRSATNTAIRVFQVEVASTAGA